MGKRRHQSSSVEEVSPVVTRRTSSRLTRSKKLKSTVKSSSPVLGKATVSIRQHQEVGNTRQQEAGPSAVKSSNRRSRLRLSNAHRLLDQDCITPVRPRHGRSHHLQLNSPHSESEPEIIWDDKSPNAVQLRRLGKGGKRNAIEDISDIINCVPEVTVDVNTKPSLLSLWMTRDSPSPKPASKSTQGSNRVSKKSGGKKKARKSRLSALTHELEKVLNAIEPDEDVLEEDEESEEVVSSPEKLPLPKTVVTVSNTTTTVTARSTSPTLYTQTKPTQKTISPRRTPLPSVGHSPNTNADQKPKPDSAEKSEEKQPCKESKSTGSEESPPGSQTKWEAIGNESAEDLWGDDDLFEDDGLLMEAIEVEIASSQMVQSTPVRKVKKRQSLKGANSVKKSASEQAKATSCSKESKPFAKPTISSTTKVHQTNSEGTKQKTFVRASTSTGVVQRASSSTGVIQSQTRSALNSGTSITSSCPVKAQTKMTTKEPISQSQRVFVPHKSNAKPSFQTFSKQSTATTTASGTSQYLPQSTSSQTTLAKSSDYSLRSGHKTPAVISKPQNTHPPVKVSSTTTSRAISAGVSTMSALSRSTSSTSINRTSPPSVTRVVYSTNPAINPSASNKPIPSSNKFVPFKSETKPSVANSSTVNVAPINSLHTSSHSTTGAKSSTVNVTPINSLNTSSQIATNPAINPSASNTSIPSSNKFVPFKSETKPSGANNSTANVVPRNSLNTSSQRTTGANCSTANVAPISSLNASSQIATNPAIDQSASNKSTSSSNKFVPFRSATKPSGANSTKNVAPISSLHTSSQSTTGANSSTVNIAPMNSSQSTRNHSKNENSNRPSASKAYVPYQKCDAPKTQCNSTQQGASGHQGITSQKSKSFVPFGKQNTPNTSLASVHGGRSQTSGQLNSSKVYVPFKKVPHTLPSTTQASCNKPPPALHSASRSTQNIEKCSKPGQGITQIAPSSSGQVSTSTAASVSVTTQSKTCPSKPAFTSSTSSKPSDNVKGKSFVPFKKPQNVSGLGSKPSNTSSSLYKPAIPSSQKPQSFTKHSNQFKPSMPRSHAISNTSMSTTPSTAASTGTNSSTSHSVSNVNPVTSKCSNNNVNLVKGQAGRVAPATSGANLNQNRTFGVSSNVSSHATSVGTGPVASSTSVEGGQFDDSLPDEMLLSLVDMDDSWDQF